MAWKKQQPTEEPKPAEPIITPPPVAQEATKEELKTEEPAVVNETKHTNEDSLLMTDDDIETGAMMEEDMLTAEPPEETSKEMMVAKTIIKEPTAITKPMAKLQTETSYYEALAEKLEAREKAMQKIMSVAISRISWANLVSFASEEDANRNQYSLTADGCIKVAQTLGIKIQPTTIWMEPLFMERNEILNQVIIAKEKYKGINESLTKDLQELQAILEKRPEPGQHYCYKARGICELPNGDTFEAEAMFSSTQKFFSKKYGKDIPADRILQDSIRSAAVSALVRTMMRMLGLQRFTEAELLRFGKTKEEIQKARAYYFAKKKKYNKDKNDEED